METSSPIFFEAAFLSASNPLRPDIRQRLSPRIQSLELLHIKVAQRALPAPPLRAGDLVEWP